VLGTGERMSRDLLMTLCRLVVSLSVAVLMDDFKYCSLVYFSMWFIQLLVKEDGGG